VVAEFMIFANKAIAEKIYMHYPTCALLRHHPFPRSNRFEDLIRIAIAKGFKIDTSSNKALARYTITIMDLG
jgi:exoribonuclease R